ncbi:UNVERIFIED_CONTAM: hypothetical protein ACS92_05070 [Bacillus cereus]
MFYESLVPHILKLNICNKFHLFRYKTFLDSVIRNGDDVAASNFVVLDHFGFLVSVTIYFQPSSICLDRFFLGLSRFHQMAQQRELQVAQELVDRIYTFLKVQIHWI